MTRLILIVALVALICSAGDALARTVDPVELHEGRWRPRFHVHGRSISPTAYVRLLDAGVCGPHTFYLASPPRGYVDFVCEPLR